MDPMITRGVLVFCYWKSSWANNSNCIACVTRGCIIFIGGALQPARASITIDSVVPTYLLSRQIAVENRPDRAGCASETACAAVTKKCERECQGNKSCVCELEILLLFFFQEQKLKRCPNVNCVGGAVSAQPSVPTQSQESFVVPREIIK